VDSRLGEGFTFSIKLATPFIFLSKKKSVEIYLMIIAMHLQPLSDAYGLLMHTNGQWEWTLAPGVSPSPRYQHAAVSYYLYHMRKLFC